MKITPDKMDTLALDWSVGQCEKRKLYLAKSKRLMTANYGAFNHRHGAPWYEPSSNWLQGGRIIEEQKIELGHGVSVGGPFRWVGSIGMGYCTGPTPLIAAMRCYVANRLRQAGLTEVELPPDIAEAYAADLARRKKYEAKRDRWFKEAGEYMQAYVEALK
jgi:hypothetical protein